jgi:hypothetical protein
VTYQSLIPPLNLVPALPIFSAKGVTHADQEVENNSQQQKTLKGQETHGSETAIEGTKS